MNKGVELIKKLALCFGPTSCEGAVAAAITEEIKELPVELSTDRMGNLVAHLVGPEGAPRVMLSAHMDEVGFMITDIDEDGFLRFGNLGGIDSRVLTGRRVRCGDERKQVAGIISAKPIHLMDKQEREKAPDPDKLYIDIGAKSREEAERMVERGSFAAFDTDFAVFGEDMDKIRCKALDDRFGCALLIEVLREAVKKPPAVDLWVCFTVREEIGLTGARAVANRIEPDAAIVIETTAIADVAGVSPHKRVASVGKGGVLSLLDRGTIYNRELLRFAMQTGDKNGIPYQIKQYVSGGNDAAKIQQSGSGVRCLALSAATRYLHAPVSVASLTDYHAMKDLVTAMLADWSHNGGRKGE